MYILLVGNVIDGLTPVGPFQTPDEANEWADQNINNDEWNCVKLNDPADEEFNILEEA